MSIRGFRFSVFAVPAALCLAWGTAEAAGCTENDVRKVAAADRLTITESAITRAFSDCPGSADRIGSPLRISRDGWLFLWFRLEGTAAYAERTRSANRFTVTVHRQGDLREGRSSLSLGRDSLDIAAVRREAGLAGNDGFFDWRLYARINAFVAGRYRVEIRHGGKRVCFPSGQCAMEFILTR